MRLTTASRMQVVKKEDKEARARSFIEQDLASRRQGIAGTDDRAYLLLARSAASPVVRAVESLAAEIRASGIEVMVMLCEADPVPAFAAADPGLTVRSLGDARFLEAHEQMVLGSTTVWLGDCMRRDPARRDAYECHAADAAEIAAWARVSFLRLWRIATPVEHPAVADGDPAPIAAPPADGILAAATAPLDPTAPLVASTRH